MDFDMQTFVGHALMGVGQQYTKNYEDYKKEQMNINAEQRRYQTDMLKEQELYTRQTARKAKEEQDAIQSLVDSGFSEEEATLQVRHGGAETKDAAFQRRLDEETQIGEAKAMAKYRAMNPNASDEELAQMMRQDYERGQMTAGERNLANVDKILANAETDEQGNPVFSKADQYRLAVLGVKVGQEKPKPVSDTVKKDVWKTSRTEAQETYSVDNMSDADAINEARELSGRPNAKISATQARAFLIENAATGNYIRGMAMITGTMVAETPDGGKISEDQANAALEESQAPQMPGTPEAPSDKFGSTSTIQMQQAPQAPRGIEAVKAARARREKRKAGPGGQRVQGLEGYKMAPSAPAGVPTLPQRQEGPATALQGDSRVDDIIGRMGN